MDFTHSFLFQILHSFRVLRIVREAALCYGTSGIRKLLSDVNFIGLASWSRQAQVYILLAFAISAVLMKATEHGQGIFLSRANTLPNTLYMSMIWKFCQDVVTTRHFQISFKEALYWNIHRRVETPGDSSIKGIPSTFSLILQCVWPLFANQLSVYINLRMWKLPLNWLGWLRYLILVLNITSVLQESSLHLHRLKLWEYSPSGPPTDFGNSFLLTY